MKKTLAISIALLLITLLVGCSNNNSSTVSEYVAPKELYQQQDLEHVTEAATTTEANTEMITEKQTEAPNVDVEWKNVTYFEEDNDGYKYEVSMKLSPWILLSNSETVNAAWDELNSGKSLPQFNDWGLKELHGYYSRSEREGLFSFSHKMTDMYYCVGEMTIKNRTEGWNITDDNKRSVNLNISWNCNYNGNDRFGSAYIWKVLFSNGAEDYYDDKPCTASMKKNTWGPVPFVIMIPENFSPKYPNGENYESIKETKIKIEKEEIELGIIGKEGK